MVRTLESTKIRESQYVVSSHCPDMRSQFSFSFRPLGHTHDCLWVGPVGGTKGLVSWTREAISELIERDSRRVLAVRTHPTDSPIFFTAH